MVGLISIVLVAFLLFAALALYAIAREDATKFLFEIAAGVLFAFLLNLMGVSDFFAYLALGISLSLAYFMKK